MKLRKSIVHSLFVCGVLLFVAVARSAAEEGARQQVRVLRTKFSSGSTSPSLRGLDLGFCKPLPPFFQSQCRKNQLRDHESDSRQSGSGSPAEGRRAATGAACSRKSADSAKQAQNAKRLPRPNAFARWPNPTRKKLAIAAKAEIEAAERAARMELKALAANLAVDGAESLLAKQLTPQSQEALIAGFVKSLQGSPN